MAEAGDCILFATADWDTPYWTNKQHTARQMAKRGMRVLYVESVGLRAPSFASGRDLSRIFRRLTKALKGVRQVEPNIWVLSPLLFPFKHHWRLVRALNQGVLRRSIARFMRRNAFARPMVWTYHPFVLESLPDAPFGRVVYHCVDDLSAVPGVDAAAFNREEERLLRKANIVFTTSPALCEKCRRVSFNVHDFPNVADIGHFSRAHDAGPLPPELQEIPQPRIGYIGVLSDFKVDFPLLQAVAAGRLDWHWVFIGEEREGQTSSAVAALRRLPNVHFLGFRAYEKLPDYLRGFDVAVLPTLLNDYTRAMFPMKYFEYLAAGVPVVATPLDFTQRHKAGLEIGRDAPAFAAAVEKQLRRGRLSREESAAFVGDNTWETRLEKMMQHVKDAA